MSDQELPWLFQLGMGFWSTKIGMILHINLMEQRMHLSRMDLRQKRPREEEAEQPNSAASRPRVAEMFKTGEELVNECSSYPSAVQHDSSSDHTAGLRDESDTAGNLVHYGHALGQLSSLGGDFGHRGGTSRWYSSESAAQIPDFSPKLKKQEGDGLEERRSLSNLFARPRDESDVHMSISARTLRPSGGKDRHSKVFTAKGPRDRRVRLSVSTAIQFYDVQDRLGYDQPSKAVEWLMKKAKNAIDELSQIPLPGLDRIPSLQQHHHAFGYSLASTSGGESVEALAQQQEQQPSWTPMVLRGLTSNSEEEAVDLKCQQQQQMNESDGLELVRRASEQQHNIIGASALGDPSRDFPCRGRSQQQEQQQQQQQQHVPFSLQSPNSSHQREWRSLLHSFSGGGGAPAAAAAAAFHHHQHHSQQQQPDERTQHLHVRAEERPTIPAAAPGFFQAPLPLPSTTRTTTTTTPSLQYHHHHHHHQQTSLITVQQNYLQPSLQQQEFVGRAPAFAFQAPGLAATPFTHHVKGFEDARSKTLPSAAAGVDTIPQTGPSRLLLNTFNNNNNNQLSAGDATTSLHFSCNTGQEQEDQASSSSNRKLGPS